MDKYGDLERKEFRSYLQEIRNHQTFLSEVIPELKFALYKDHSGTSEWHRETVRKGHEQNQSSNRGNRQKGQERYLGLELTGYLIRRESKESRVN